MSDDFSYEITEKLGVLAEGKGGWNLELNKVSWGGRPAKYDVRSWSSDHKKMGKGCTFNSDELKALKDLLNSIEIN